MGEDFDFDNDDSQCTSSSIQAPAPRMHTVQKDTPLEPWESILNDAHEIPVTDHPSEDDRVKYFKLCLAAHFSSVASFVPTGKEVTEVIFTRLSPYFFYLRRR